MQKNVEIEAEELVNETTSANRSRPLVQVFDQLSDCLCRVADMVRKTKQCALFKSEK